MVFDNLFVNLPIQLLIELIIFPEKSAGIRNPLQVKRKIFEFPIIRSDSAITTSVNQNDFLPPRRNEVKIIAVVKNSIFGPRSKTVLSRKAAKKRNTNNRFTFNMDFFIGF